MIRARVACFGMLCGIMIACLWPFHEPINDVTWQRDGNGIRLGLHGSLISEADLKQDPSSDKTGGSLEVWMEPALTPGRQVILAFDSARHPGAAFLIEQNGDALFVQRHNVDPYGICRTAYFGVPRALELGRPVVITVVLNAHETLVYINGSLAKSSEVLGDSAYNLTGRLVVGNSSVVADSWSGMIRGLAVYDGRLTGADVERHAQAWHNGHAPALTPGEMPVALYLFDEHRGKIVHNHFDSAADLLIPTHFFVLHPRFLTPAWERFRFGWPGWSYWQDALLNIAGFVPLGLVLMNYLLSMGQVKHPFAAVVLAGFLFSLTMESLQWFLPTRDSDMTDVITNTLGAGLGATFCRAPAVRNLLVRFSS